MHTHLQCWIKMQLLLVICVRGIIQLVVISLLKEEEIGQVYILMRKVA